MCDGSGDFGKVIRVQVPLGVNSRAIALVDRDETGMARINLRNPLGTGRGYSVDELTNVSDPGAPGLFVGDDMNNAIIMGTLTRANQPLSEGSTFFGGSGAGDGLKAILSAKVD